MRDHGSRLLQERHLVALVSSMEKVERRYSSNEQTNIVEICLEKRLSKLLAQVNALNNF